MSAGCDSLLEVELPGETTAEALDNPGAAALLVLSAQGDFECAYSNWAFNSANLSGEILGASGALIAIPLVTRNVQSHHTAYGQDGCGGPYGLYTPLQTARFQAEDSFARLDGYSDADVPGRVGLMARAALYAGFTYAVFGEGFCEAAFDLGPARTPAEIFGIAEERFTTAIDLATQAGDAETVSAAYVGRARVRLPLGDLAGAGDDAAMVPEGFRLDVTRSNAANTRQNDFYETVAEGGGTSATVDPNYWSVEWMGVPDPRVAVVDAQRLTSNARTPLWYQTKYTSESAPIRLASYVEAQLVIAEVEGGQTAVDIINELHTAAGIPPFTSADEAEIQAHIKEERRREFFLEGRRMGDLRRLGGFSEVNGAGEVNPWTFFAFGGTECFELPDVERQNNPNLSGG